MQHNKYTLVLGASEKPERYSNKAIKMLLKYKHPILAIGQKIGQVEGIPIQTEKSQFEDVDTVTLYLGPQNQAPYIDYILSLKPRRIIFNPGTENDHFVELATKQHIQCIEACTLVMLSTGQYD